MEWGQLIGPAVVAAVVSGIVTTIGFAMNRSTSLTTHREKLNADKALAERKVSADIALAERKLSLDRKLADWKRRTEIAEQTLADFYKANDIFTSARQPFSIGNEGATRQRPDNEPENETGYNNAIYTPYERLLSHREFLAEMHSRRFRFMALFGDVAAEPFMAFVQTFNNVGSATGMLLDRRFHENQELRSRQEEIIGWGVADEDPIKVRLDAAVAQIEALCAPILREHPE